AYVSIRWIYALHFIFIENKSISKAMAASWRLTRHHKVRLVITMILWNAFIIVAGFLIMTLLSQLAVVVDSKAIGDFIGNYLLAFSCYVSIALSLFIMPMNMIMLTNFYYMSLTSEGNPATDHVSLGESSFLDRLEKKVTHTFKKRKGIVISIAALGLAVIVVVNGVIQSSIVYLPFDVEVAGH